MSIVGSLDLVQGKLYRVKPFPGYTNIGLYKLTNIRPVIDFSKAININHKIIVMFLSLIKRPYGNLEKHVLYNNQSIYVDRFSLFEEIEGLNYDK